MSRATIDELRSAHPMFDRLPAILRGEGLGHEPVVSGDGALEPMPAEPAAFTREFLGALDTVIAPALLTLDCLDAYVDPRLTPTDFLPWLASWVGVRADERWSDEQLRAVMAVAVSLYRRRGTARGLRGLVRAYTGVEPEIEDSGGSTIAAERRPGAPADDLGFPGSVDAWARVRVTTTAANPVDADRLEELVAASVPATVRVVVEVRTTDG